MRAELRGPVVPVSVVIPAYQRAALLRRALASVHGQTGVRPAEIVVVDDASTDGTADVARELGARVVVHEANRGEGGARNSGIRAASQEWVALLDCDDEWLPGHLAALWPLRGDHVLVADACIGRGEHPWNGRTFGWPGPHPRVLRSPAELVWPENVVTSSTVLLRRDSIEAAGGFPEAMPQAADFDTWVRVLEHGTGLLIPSVGAVYHLHGDGQASSDNGRMAAARLDVLDRYRARPWFDPRVPDRLRAVHAWDRRDHVALARALLRPSTATGFAEVLAYRRRKRGAARRAATALADDDVSSRP